MEIPKTKTITLSEAERFKEGLKMIKAECNPTHVMTLQNNTIRLIFRDDSIMGEEEVWQTLRGYDK